jgi:hypothetical protein
MRRDPLTDDRHLDPPLDEEPVDEYEAYLQQGDEMYDDLSLDEIDERYGDM